MRHFDAIGRVPEVMKKIETYVPEIFPGQGRDFVPGLNKIIGEYAGNNGWDFVVVSLNKGLAREELEEFLERDIDHEGPIVIDPTASTHEHQVYPSRLRARVQKERLIKLNEATADVMLILYGVDKVDRTMQREFLMKRVRMSEASMDLLDRDLATREAAHNSKTASSSHIQKKVDVIKERLKHLGKYGETRSETEAQTETDHTLSAELFTLLAMARYSMDGIDDQAALDAMQNIQLQFQGAPEEFKQLNVSFEPYERMALDVIDRERRDQAELKANAPDLTPDIAPPDVRDADNNGTVDPGNKYSGQSFNPQHKPI